MDGMFDDKSGSDRSDCTDLSDDDDDDFDSESESSGDESDIVVPLMDVGASPSRHAGMAGSFQDLPDIGLGHQ